MSDVRSPQSCYSYDTFTWHCTWLDKKKSHLPSVSILERLEMILLLLLLLFPENSVHGNKQINHRCRSCKTEIVLSSTIFSKPKAEAWTLFVLKPITKIQDCKWCVLKCWHTPISEQKTQAVLRFTPQRRPVSNIEKQRCLNGLIHLRYFTWHREKKKLHLTA